MDYAFDERNEERFEAWTSDFQDLFDPVEMIEVEHPEGSRWLVLESNFRRVEQPPIEEDEYKVLRRNVGLAVTGYFVQADHAEALLKWLKGQQTLEIAGAGNNKTSLSGRISVGSFLQRI